MMAMKIILLCAIHTKIASHLVLSIKKVSVNSVIQYWIKMATGCIDSLMLQRQDAKSSDQNMRYAAVSSAMNTGVDKPRLKVARLAKLGQLLLLKRFLMQDWRRIIAEILVSLWKIYGAILVTTTHFWNCVSLLNFANNII